MSTETAVESRSFQHYHESELLDRLRETSDRLPAGYAATLRPLGIRIRDTALAVTYCERDRGIEIVSGIETAATVIELSHESWEQLTRDLESSAGLI